MTDIAPLGWHTVTPRLFADDPLGLVDFIKGTFGATGGFLEARPSELRLGDSIVMVSGSEARGSSAACLYVYVPDVDDAYTRALERGASCVEKPQLMHYGDRRCVVKDSWNNLWQIATRKELL